MTFIAMLKKTLTKSMNSDNKPKLEYPNDPQLKALRTLMEAMTTAQDRAEIEDAIQVRINQLKRPKPMF